MAREQAIAKRLNALSPLIPEYLSFFTLDGREAFLQPLIEGRLWHDVVETLSKEENEELWRQLGVFAKAFHSCGGETFGYPPPFEEFERWSDFITDNVKGMVADCHRLGIHCEEIETYCRLLPQFSAKLDAIKTPKLLHGDLWPRNVLIEGNGASIRLKAVFDAERAFWGDPVSDWVLILFGKPDSFWQGYGENLEETSDPARVAVYKGMYFILNILEATRFDTAIAEPRGWLAGINKELEAVL